MRTFIAIELPIEIKNSLSKIQEKLTQTLKISWVKPQNLHLTLKFLGDISPKQLNKIRQIITEITKTTSDFKIKLETLGIFPNAHAARIIWIGANQLPLELKQLTERLETRLAESGIPQEQRFFCAHITIGRIKSHFIPSDLKKAFDKVENDVTGANWEFDCKEITLFESTLGPDGPTYIALERLNFLK
ncbi:MAG: RNA 2',3'-cyclic phosphodiesterase [Candidatus Omnitrophica bacterium]|nr:RNA 2',3'-cyclic phosphodiesterase [Candidatus Omnitrophota bacterium]MBU1923901.1 RNA 2',3'-cyclic phosphodiesterase [Candidatus Omnitrophota bacterium]